MHFRCKLAADDSVAHWQDICYGRHKMTPYGEISSNFIFCPIWGEISEIASYFRVN